MDLSKVMDSNYVYHILFLIIIVIKRKISDCIFFIFFFIYLCMYFVEQISRLNLYPTCAKTHLPLSSVYNFSDLPSSLPCLELGVLHIWRRSYTFSLDRFMFVIHLVHWRSHMHFVCLWSRQRHINPLLVSKSISR